MENLVSDIGVKKVIKFTKDYQSVNRYYPVQMNINDSKVNEEFLRYCEQFSKYTFIDALGGSEAPDGARRYRIDLKFEDVVHMAHTGIVCGIKVNHFPQWKIEEWEKWEDGYIEVFIRMDADNDNKHLEWFIWQYVEMKYLKNILTNFQNNLIFWDYFSKFGNE